ncbi:DUF6547 family protein [Paenibacillus sp. PDC88]|uniref:DUF6547 family protein n=1 Tax=Paenibacillus provencensis TaxID=441151 RepID=A0ABW3Q9X2_9BACL|nr:DUF6547 family protein [Paenibacillus sp. PDC88]SDX88809.1 hypothetical protein SAMN05518848_12329 [Paenibacillus sp. PDC88]
MNWMVFKEMEKQAVELYKEFIDDLVEIRECVLSEWIKQNSWPNTNENEEINKVLSELSTEQKEVFALIAQSARESGIHDVLVYLTDQISIGGLEIYKNDIKLATEPFDSGMHYDWVSRKEGDIWPDLND